MTDRAERIEFAFVAVTPGLADSSAARLHSRCMNPPLVEMRHVSKTYRLWAKPADRLASMMLEQSRGWRILPAVVRRAFDAAANRRGSLFNALSDVSFTLQKGESLGIIGRNGSGKSTCLQILAGTLEPTAGDVCVTGRIAALLELGSGFNLEFSGRENVILQAALFGFSRRDILSRMSEVEEFAGIGGFIDQPAKVYSSGMLVRLAFATQTILAPELFIVDEALAVGDVFFQAKCARFFEDRLKTGMSLILVSHDLVAVKALCRRAIVLHEGRMAFLGPSADAVSHYHQLHRGQAGEKAAKSPAPPRTGSGVTLPPGVRERNWTSSSEVGSREVEVIHCRLLDSQGRECAMFDLDSEVRLEFFTRGRTPLESMMLGIEISNRHNQVVYGVSSVHLGIEPRSVQAGEVCQILVAFNAAMGAGDYLVDIALGSGDRGDGAPVHLVHRVARIASFTIRHPGARPSFFGAVNLGARLEIV